MTYRLWHCYFNIYFMKTHIFHHPKTSNDTTATTDSALSFRKDPTPPGERAERERVGARHSPPGGPLLGWLRRVFYMRLPGVFDTLLKEQKGIKRWVKLVAIYILTNSNLPWETPKSTLALLGETSRLTSASRSLLPCTKRRPEILGALGDGYPNTSADLASMNSLSPSFSYKLQAPRSLATYVLSSWVHFGPSLVNLSLGWDILSQTSYQST